MNLKRINLYKRRVKRYVFSKLSMSSKYRIAITMILMSPVLPKTWGVRARLFKRIFDDQVLMTQKSDVVGSKDGLIELKSYEEIPFFDAELSELKIAIHLHLYYLDLSEEFAGHLKKLPTAVDLFISVCSEEDKVLASKCFSNAERLGGLVVEVMPNRGRDMAPFISGFGESLRAYDVVGHFHTKKSLYNNNATQGWREYLWTTLFSSQDNLKKIFGSLGSGSVGMVYPQTYSGIPYVAHTWMANRYNAQLLCDALGIRDIPNSYFDFPVGSMFWASGVILEPLFDVGLKVSDFEKEQGQTDGTMAHAIERVLGLCADHVGKRTLVIKDNYAPSRFRWRLEQYYNRGEECTRQTVASAQFKLIGFDIFDTLLERPFANPEYVKVMMTEWCSGRLEVPFEQLRVTAEVKARARFNQDVNIDQIYEVLAEELDGQWSSSDVDALKMLELKLESSCIKSRSEGHGLYEWALSQGKPVILISDMFLPESVIEEMLRKAGYEGWSKLYVSNSWNKRKDSGELYRAVLSECGVANDEFLMVGDNERSDWQIPVDSGSSALHLMRPIDCLASFGASVDIVKRYARSPYLGVQLTLGLIANKLASLVDGRVDHDYPFSSPYRLGYSVLGPVLVAFSEWLAEKAKRNGVSKLLFLSREGKLLKKAFDSYASMFDIDIKTEYFVVSRRCVTVAAICSEQDVHDISRQTYMQNRLEFFLKERFGLELCEIEWAELKLTTGLEKRSLISVTGGDASEVETVIEALMPRILAAAESEKRGLLKYSSDGGFFNEAKVSLVDVGYGGTIQVFLNSLISERVDGLYLGTDARAVSAASKSGSSLEGCFFEAGKEGGALFRLSFELEKMLSADEAQVVNYDSQGVARHKELSDAELASRVSRKELQGASLEFVKDLSEYAWLSGYTGQGIGSKKLAENLFEAYGGCFGGALNKISLDDHYCGRGVV